jgi:outer membrane protein assembly factor BamD (BamD/ComL family)
MTNILTNMKKTGFSLILMTLLTLFAVAQEADGRYGSTPEEEEECKKNLSLYREYRDQNLPAQALPFWREAFRICPQSAKTIFIDGKNFYGDILDKIYEDESKAAARDAYLDTLMLIYDKRIEHFGEEGKVLAYKANDLFKYDPSRAKEANAIMKRSLELEGNESDAVAASKYYEMLYRMYQNKEATKSDLLVEYMPVLDILDFNIAKLEDEAARLRYEKAKSNLDAFFVKIAECDDIYKILGERIAESPNDIELNKKSLAVMNKRECTDSDLYLEIAERVYRDKPNAASAYSIGIQKLKAKDYSQAAKYFEEAVNLCGDCIDLEQYLLRAGQTATIQGNTSKAISYANRILQVKPRSGEAYMLKGDAIASGANAAAGEKLGAAGAYLLAVDYYNKARSMDPSVAEKAGQKAAGYQKYFPLKTDVFFVNLNVGDNYLVEQFGESTTIRTRD